ncbi:hypothetical protein bpln_1g09360 [Burkholderia plantarii]|nr:hypothetical protein bpln_1g09360 [Burkholderia plantarii]
MSGGTRAIAGRALLCCHEHAGAGMMAGELPEEARTDTTGRRPWAPANAASKHGCPPRAPCGALSLLPGNAARSTRRKLRATSLGRHVLRPGRSGEYRIQPDFPAWGVLPWFDVAWLRTLRETTPGARRHIRNRQRDRLTSRRAAAAN